jgi:hypothetical protein
MKRASIILAVLVALQCRAIESVITADTTQPAATLTRLEGMQGAALDVRVYIRQAGQVWTNGTTASLTLNYGTNLTAATMGTATGGTISAAGSCLVRIPALGAPMPFGQYLLTVVQGGVTNSLGTGVLNIRATSFTGQGVLQLGPTSINTDNYTLTGTNPWLRVSDGITASTVTNIAAALDAADRAAASNLYFRAVDAGGGVYQVWLP